MTNAAPPRRTGDANRPATGPVRDGEIYLLQDFARLMGLKAKALRHARRKGLRIIHFGTRGYVFGRDWISLLERIAAEQEKAP